MNAPNGCQKIQSVSAREAEAYEHTGTLPA